MKLSNIHSKYVIQELFSFISIKQKFKLVKNNLNQEKNLNILIEDNKLSDIAIKVIKNIFNIFSIDGKMNKTQYALYLINILKNEVNENDSVVENIFFKYNRNRNGLLTFDEFCEFNLDLIKYGLYYLEDYNSNLLEFILNNIEEFDINSNNIFSNLYKISKQKIYKLSLFININKIFIEFLNNNQLFQNII